MKTMSLEWPEQGIAMLVLDRPDRLNAINLAMYDEFDDVLDRLRDDRETRVVIITGAGRGFCSGQDLKELGADQAASGLGRVQFGMAWQARAAALVQRIHRLPHPVVAAVNGAAAGAGLAIAARSGHSHRVAVCEVQRGLRAHRAVGCRHGRELFPSTASSVRRRQQR